MFDDLQGNLPLFPYYAMILDIVSNKKTDYSFVKITKAPFLVYFQIYFYDNQFGLSLIVDGRIRLQLPLYVYSKVWSKKFYDQFCALNHYFVELYLKDYKAFQLDKFISDEVSEITMETMDTFSLPESGDDLDPDTEPLSS